MDIIQRARNTASALISGRNGPNVCASAAGLLVSLADEMRRTMSEPAVSFEGILGGGETDLPSVLAAEIMGLKWAYDGTTEDVLCERHGQLQEVIAAILSNGSWRIEYVPPSA